MATRRTQADRTIAARASLVAAAATILSERGFAHATTALIAAQASVTTGALHHHFATKEELFFAVLDEATEDIIAQFKALEEEGEHGKCPAAKLINSLWTVYGNRKYWAVWEINIGLRSNPELYAQLIAHRTQTSAKIRQAILENGALSQRTRQALLQFLPFILAAIRGIFLDTFMRTDEAFLKKQLAVLIGMFQRELESLAEPDDAASTPARRQAQGYQSSRVPHST